MELDYADLYLIHQPYHDYYGAWNAMEELYAEGKVKAIGVDKFTQDKLDDFLFFNKVKPAINMIECNAFYQRKEDLVYMKEQNIQIRMKENIDIFDFELTAEEMDKISALDTGHTCFGERKTASQVTVFLNSALKYRV